MRTLEACRLEVGGKQPFDEARVLVNLVWLTHQLELLHDARREIRLDTHARQRDAKLRHALRDADTALELNANDAAALALKRDAERAKKLALRENKKLAKEVTQWVETAQGKFQENGGDETQCAQQ